MTDRIAEEIRLLGHARDLPIDDPFPGHVDRSRRRRPARCGGRTPRPRAVAVDRRSAGASGRHLVSGLSNKQIARALGFSVDGAKAHRKAIDVKLGATDRAEATIAVRLALVRVCDVGT